MAMWDPDAAGNAAIYLRLDEMKMIEIRSAPFSAKTAVWVPDKENGYIKGEKLDEKDGKIEVKRADDKVKMYKPEDVEQQNPPKYELIEGRLWFLIFFYNGSQLKNPDISGAIFTLNSSIRILNSQCVEGVRDVGIL